MDSVRNWASGLGMAVLILCGPTIALLILTASEMLPDLLIKERAIPVYILEVAAIGWVMLRKFGPQSPAPQLRSERA
jgi:hypothetical protein